MKGTANAFILGVLALVIGTELIGGSSKKPRPSATSQRVEASLAVSLPPPAQPVEGAWKKLEPGEKATPVALAERTDSTDEQSNFAAQPVTTGVCAVYNPIEHPEQILDILILASAESCRVIEGLKVCTPVEILYAIWQKETGQVDGNGKGSGGYPVMMELRRRDGDRGTHHGAAMLGMGKHFGWNQVYGENLERMTCSPPKLVPVYDPVTGKEVGKKTYGYGGCCGPFQFSGDEIDEMAIKLNLDPLRFCGGAIIAAKDLLKRYERAVKKGHAQGYPAWRRAISSYYGRDPGSVYYLRALTKWEEFSNWQACEYREGGWFRKSGEQAGQRCDAAALDRQWAHVRDRLVQKSRHSVNYFRGLRQ